LPPCSTPAKPDEVLFRQHLAAVLGSAWRHFRQLGFELACLPYEAWFSLDAIARTAWRLHVSHRRLLEWNPSSEVERQMAGRRRSELLACLRSMWTGPLLAIGLGAWLVLASQEEMLIAAPVLLLWLASPILAWWLSRPLTARKAHLTVEQGFFLRRMARRTWAFFDHFVGPDDNWLAPDNYQEYRVAAIAHRTSPTNMGLALLANLSAWDFGYIPSGKLVERTSNTLRTMVGPEALSRALLQLVRHADPATTPAALHLDRRQRQSGRASVDPARRPARTGRCADPATTLAVRPQRYPRSARRER
jgi:hypothetical protein